MTEKKCLLTLL